MDKRDVVWLRLLSVIWILSFNEAAEELYQPTCREQQGMNSGTIKDHMITASSTYDVVSVGPRSARIRKEQKGGAWCPKRQIADDVYEWLQVDLGDYKLVTLVETQGRFGNGQGQEYAEKYSLEYQREDGDEWVKYFNRFSQSSFDGNSNTYIAELREVNPPIVARRLRFVPGSTHERTVCMRVEVYGCAWKSGVLAYNMRQGDRRGAEVDLFDFSYDGHASDNYLSDGLGQLIDGEEGRDNFRLDPTGTGRKGYEWVGWKNESMNIAPVEIDFKFDKIRNFSSIRIHSNNMFSKDVRVFRKVEVYFSVGGEYYQPEPLVFRFMRDELMEFARPIIIAVPHRLGKFIKLRLYFDSRWMMISEVKFESEVVTGNVTTELSPGLPPLGTTHNPAQSVAPRGPRLMPNDTPSHNGTRAVLPPSEKEKEKLPKDHIGIISGAIAAFVFIMIVILVVLIILRHRRRKNGSSHRIKQSFDPGHVTLNLHDLPPIANGKISNGNKYNSLATSDLAEPNGTLPKLANGDTYPERFDVIQARKLPELPKTPESDTNTSREYAVPDISKSMLSNGKNSFKPNIIPDEQPPPPPLPPHPSALYGGQSEVMTYPNLQGVSGNNVYAVPNADLLWKEDLSVMEFPRGQLKFVEKLGEGQFGEVHLCEAMRITDFLGDDFLINRTGSRSMLVAVKSLRKNADQHAREDYQKEVRIMSKLKDPNIVRVLGVVTQDEPYCVIVEYMKYGDLNQYLHQHCAESTMARNQQARTLSYGSLIYMATQIASGMKYLESLNMVHRDLATRNCLVGPQFTIKISDFGMSRSLYSADYYRIEGKAVLPIRWMAWESVLLGKFSSKSDVWSFAVTLWEVLLFAKEQPYDDLTDEQVIENCGHYYRNDGQIVDLPQPQNCPKEIFDLMRECWNREEVQRPAFREIHMFLQRKNMGYDPKDDFVKSFANQISVPIV